MADKDASVAVITDSVFSPVNRYAALSFQMPLNYMATVDQLGAAMIFIQTVVLEYCLWYEANATKSLALFEEFVGKNTIFHKAVREGRKNTHVDRTIPDHR